MKLSISVPNELWDEARSLAADSDSTSSVVQEALRRWVSQERRRRNFADNVPDDAQVVLQEIRERLAREAGATFQHGYGQGLQCAKRLPWSTIEGLAVTFGFRVNLWAQQWVDAAQRWKKTNPTPNRKETTEATSPGFAGRGRRPRDWAAVDAEIRAEAEGTNTTRNSPYAIVRTLVPALGNLAEPYGHETSFTPGPTYLRGFTQAMRDVWSSVAEGMDASKG